MIQPKDKQNYQYSLLGRFLTLMALAFIMLIIIIGWKIEKVRKNDLEIYLSTAVNNVTHNLNDNLTYTADKMRFLGSLITNNNQQDYVKIRDLLKVFAIDPKLKKMMLWGTIVWVDNQDRAVVDSYSGILKFPKILVPYIKEVVNKPYLLHYGKTLIGYVSGTPVIPAAMGLNNSAGKFLGSMTIGIDIEKLNARIKKSVQNDNIDYAIFSVAENGIITKSSNFDRKDTIKITEDVKKFINEKGNKKIYKIENNYYVLSKIGDFPFIIIAGINSKTFGYEQYFTNLSNTYELGIIFLGICGIILLFYASILDPFIKLSNSASAISQGDFLAPIPIIHSKEGSMVASALEQIKLKLKTEMELITELSDARNKLSITNVRLENKVTERTNELETALEARNAFLNNLSHEIKTPLQVVGSTSEGLVTHWLEYSEQKKFELAHQLSYNAKKLLDLVGNLLDLSKFSAGKMILNFTKLDLVALIFEITEECKAIYIGNKNININFYPSAPIYISADKDKMAQLLRNLFINSIKFSPNNSSIGIKLFSTEMTGENGKRYEALHFMVHDQGEGIIEEELEAIFSPFTQGAAAKNKKDGVGLGLAICRKIVNAHNGTIWAVKNKDGGATFNFVMPIKQPNIKKTGLIYHSSKELHQIQPNILIIDDEEVCLSSMELLLHGSKYNLIKANSGHLGLKYLQNHAESISLIFLDLMMPDMYGLNVLSEIKKHPILSKIPIILQSGTSDEYEIVKAFDMGVHGFIRKPYQKEIVFKEIETAIKKGQKKEIV